MSVDIDKKQGGLVGGNVYAPLKSAGDLDREVAVADSHTEVPQAAEGDRQKDYEKFIQEVNATAARGGSIESIRTLLSQYPSLSSQTNELMANVEQDHPNLPKTEEEYQQQIQENHQNISQVLMGGAAVASTAAPSPALSGIAAMLVGALERYKDGPEALGMPPKAVADAQQAGTTLALFTQGVSAPAAEFSGPGRPTLGIPAKVQQQNIGITS